MNDTNDLWKRCGEALREQVSDATWRTWLAGLAPESFDGDLLVLGAPSTLVRDRVESRFLGLLAAAASDAAGHEVKVRLEVVAATPPEPEETLFSAPFLDDPTPSPDRHPRHPVRPRTDAGPDQLDDIGLDPRYTLRRLRHRRVEPLRPCRRTVGGRDARPVLQPLFIHGDSGLGKTHLLHAIGHYVRENFPRRHIRYVSTETFINEFVDAIRNNTTTAFKRRYRDCDMLLVDDIQFMEGKEALQEEFFHTFNSLYGSYKQIVLTSDRPPKSIATLEDRLRSRFEWGLITDVQPPELETRMAILAQEGGTGGRRHPRRGARAHRHPRQGQHPRARRRPHPGDGVHQPQP